MKYLFSDLPAIENLIINRRIILFLDYDGTLTPIVNRPDKAILSKSRKALLRKLTNLPDLKIIIISGRGLNDIKSRVDLKNIIYAGNHGLEIEGRGIKFKSPVSPVFKRLIKKIAYDLSGKLSAINGLLIENKNLSLSIHYRLVAKRRLSLLKRLLDETTQPYANKKKIKIDHGKKVIEIKPPVKWNKGKAVLWLINKLSKNRDVIPVYIGDDKTDEDAFKVLRNKGLIIFVGLFGSLYPQYYLKNTREVIRFLNQILELKKIMICQN